MVAPMSNEIKTENGDKLVAEAYNEINRIDEQERIDRENELNTFGGSDSSTVENTLTDEEKANYKHRALCIGINAYAAPNTLAGCVNDSQDWAKGIAARGKKLGAKFLQAFLLNFAALKLAVLASIKKQVAATKSGHWLVVVNSGHGTRIVDKNGDEADGYDECLCPIDCDEGQLITDDELYDIFSSKNDGAHIIFITDSCHSGTITRDLDDKGKPRFYPSGVSPTAKKREKGRVAPVITLSACRADEYSYDAVIDGRPCGAFSHYALGALADMPIDATYRDWHAEICRRVAASGYDMTPQLEGPAEELDRIIFG
jgi:metacaspase-1